MRMTVILGAVAAAFALAGVDSAVAFPVAGAARDLAARTTPVEQVRQGCGWGWHRGPWGGCRRNWGPYGNYCWYRPGPWGPVRVCR